MEDVAELLRNPAFSTEEAVAAIRGESLPRGLARRVMRLCVIRGIRYHLGFADGPASVLSGSRSEFTRALNARAIMSNRVPDMDPSRNSDEHPYCIWHPDIALEDTCRKLVLRYPSMVYQVGRACAVAGYAGLYSALDILPDVSIAEEARTSGCTAILETITSQPVKYKIMDDYMRTIRPENPQPACMNGDAAVQPMLNIKQRFSTPSGKRDEDDPEYDIMDNNWDLFGGSGFTETLYNITEDMNIDEVATDMGALERNPPAYAAALTLLLTVPLPLDLPEGNKDILILMAAYNGDIDRYARLRRPKMHPMEPYCIIRGIYHSTFFAHWWSQPKQMRSHRHAWYGDYIAQAINARFIMNNDLSRLTPFNPSSDASLTAEEALFKRSLPYLIWYPAVAEPTTYSELARRIPSMRPAVLRAAVFADMSNVFDELMAEAAFSPDGFALVEAENSPHPYYRETITKRARELEVNLSFAATSERTAGLEQWKWYSLRPDAKAWRAFPRTSNVVPRILGPMQISGGRENIETCYNGIGCDASTIELFVSLPDGWKPTDEPAVDLDYVTWPLPGSKDSY
jgi:hypothetical protein